VIVNQIGDHTKRSTILSGTRTSSSIHITHALSEGVAEISQILLRDYHVLAKIMGDDDPEEYCRRDR
jgi:hypothetical protein